MQKTFNYQQTQISYQLLGEGQPVLMLHGFGEDSSIWNLQVADLKKHFKLVVPDLPGSGLSTGLPNWHGVNSLEEMAHAMATLMQDLGEEKYVVLGHSMGGYIALVIAAFFPERLTGLGLVHSSAFADSKEKIETRLKAIDFVEKNGVGPFWETAIPNLFGEKFKTEYPEIVQKLVKAGERFSVENVQAYYRAMIARPDRTAALAESTVPVLFIIGEEDKAVPAADSFKQVHLPATAFVHQYPEVGHMSMLEAPEKLNQHLLQFLHEVQKTELLKTKD